MQLPYTIELSHVDGCFVIANQRSEAISAV